MNLAKNRKKIALVLVLILAVVGVCWVLASRRAPMVVVGNLSQKDVAEITRAVRHQMWRNTFKRVSWKMLKELPGNVLRNATCHISGVYGEGSSAVVLVANSKSRPPTMFEAQKGEKGWMVFGGP
jgi:hypothetical protein